jgi:tetratricopeptide (TPR) repeat protein
VSLQGIVEIRRANQPVWEPVKQNDPFMVGDTVRIGAKSRADIALVNETVIRLDQNTTIMFSGPEKGGFSILELIKGALYFLTNRPRTLKIATPFVNGVIEGTEFYAMVDDVKTLFTIFKGRVALANNAGTLGIREGQSAIAMANKAPVIHIVAKPRDAVQWTLYYPPVLICTKAELLPARPLDARAFTCRASELLAVGRVDEAQPDLDRALSLSPRYGSALALQSIVALVQNEKTKAVELAQKAVQEDSHSASSWIALSYAQQGSFDLEGALKSIEQARKAEPENALARARLSDLQLSFGHLDNALNAAQEAEKINPHVSRIQTVLGFAYLTRIKVHQAKSAFEKAILLDQADPLPRLGLGLAMIREGDIEKGRREIEIAASLDPQNSLIRSYLGKAYYDEKREKQAGEQYALAKQFDPNDPSPYLYNAILKQSTNRPVEALYDLERSIALNDQRAVYRSRLLLDEDTAVRQANIAKIYSELGFEQRALVEGWKSVNTDPSNYSAHRFLADSYAALPRHEIARVSELLQSQLLQPINLNPVQPSLSLVDNQNVGGLGFATPSFNEYAPLFNRNRFTLSASGVGGENGTWGEEVVQSGVWDRWSYSIGQLHYESDGYRKNNDTTRDVYNLFGQLLVTPKTSVQIELRSSRSETGDIEQRFFSYDFYPNLRIKDDRDSGRFGIHHQLSPGSDIIASVAFRDEKGSLKDTFLPYIFDWKIKEKGGLGELQYLLRRKSFNLVCGGGYAEIDQKETFDVIETGTPYVPAIPIKATIKHTNLYVYSNITYPKTLTVTIGASGDILRGALVDRTQVNPKFGITWNPIPSTTFRAAAFRTLTRMGITEATIEPTQVAGFNQFYDDIEWTRAWQYGAAIDQKFSQHFYGGIEYSQRDIDSPVLDEVTTDQPIVQQPRWKERLGRAYLYWTPHQWFALTGEYLYEKLDRNKLFGGGIEEVTTHRAPLGIGFFHPSGFTGRLRITYIDQRGKFVLNPYLASVSASNQFWVVDAAISYRLPQRYGMLTLGVNNLFNRSFKYQDTDPWNPRIQPDRFAYFRVTLAF